MESSRRYDEINRRELLSSEVLNVVEDKHEPHICRLRRVCLLLKLKLKRGMLGRELSGSTVAIGEGRAAVNHGG